MIKITTKFYNNKIPREGFQFIDLSVILILKYYPEVFLEECKNVVKEKKNPKNIVDDIEFFSDSDRENSDEENSNEENSDEENFDEKNSDEENFDEENSDEVN